MEIVRELKGGSLSRTVVVRDGPRLLVRKFISISSDREYGLVRWHSQVRKIQLINKFFPDSCVNLIRLGEHKGFYFYDIPYYDNCLDCYSAVVSNKCSPSLMSEKIVDLLRDFSSIEFGDSVGSLSVYLNEEVLSPAYKALDVIDSGKVLLSPVELEYFKNSVLKIIPKISRIISELESVSCHESLTHGNLTLENLLWDESKQKLIMIDPYAETYCESIIGDVSQLLQSSQSGYEYISKLLSGKDFSIFDYPIKSLPEPLNTFTEILMKRLGDETWFSKEHLLIFRASQFTRMFPFKIATEPRLGILFMLHAFSLLNEF